ncbi:cholesterol 7-desaturase nvd [Bicyclus anynana]|uniref:cholesterol 7-desaturase n=1 Tax=Bicyclus anynana TaxID=110368 RepID=A0ABM3M445_BICAN|nr:cholesterol 7-desaturase nvd [Bicyclus anynana]XP_052746257.1 cholesterol 7-desaturase nvd [Bicyclus anynana]
MASEINFKIDQHCHDVKANFDVLLITSFIINIIKAFVTFVSSCYKVILVVAFIFVLLYVLYKSYWNPVLYRKELSDTGYNHLPKKDRSLHIISAQNKRKFGNKLPPPYPNGWFSLVESRDLAVGGVISVDALGLNLCVYRGEDGVARIVDAYCPHLGANLGVGGSVCGTCIECPFHQWRFGVDGACVSIPGMESVPKGISIKTYHAMEVDGSVWVWYHVDGLPPQWTVPESEAAKSWGYRGRNEFLVNAHIQEIPENGADVAHLNAVHNISIFSDAGVKYPFLNRLIGHHIWGAEWQKGDEDHVAKIKISQKYLILKMDVFPLEITVNQIGPAHVRLSFMSSLGPMTVLQSVTPLGPLLQKVVHRVYSPGYNAPLGAAMVWLEAKQFERDVAIWNHKRYVSAPAYAKNDKTIRAFRSWFNQFYSDNSISLRDALQNPLDW